MLNEDIIPSIITSTAAIVGLNGIEIIKLLKGKKNSIYSLRLGNKLEVNSWIFCKKK